MTKKDLRVEYRKLSDIKDKIELAFRRAGLNDSAFSLSIHPKDPEQPYEGYAVYIYLTDKENEVFFGFCTLDDDWSFAGFVQNNLTAKYWEEQELPSIDALAESIEVVPNLEEFLNFFFKRPYTKLNAAKRNFIKNNRELTHSGVN